MGQNTEELTTTPADIEATRADLTRNIDELSDKVSPQRVVERRKEAARNSLSSVRDKIMGSADEREEQRQRGRLRRARLGVGCRSLGQGLRPVSSRHPRVDHHGQPARRRAPWRSAPAC